MPVYALRLQKTEATTFTPLPCPTFLVAQAVKDLPTIWETGLDPWVGKIPWRREWQPTPVFLPGKPHEQRSLVGYGVAKSRT